MKEESIPYRKTVFVCVHARSDGRTSCGDPGRGGVELAQALKDCAKRLGLKDTIRVAKTGCLDLCEMGPNVFLYPDDQWLSDLKPEDADAILKKAAAK